MNLLTFENALNSSKIYSKRHLLLGNGFSIACKPNIFVYKKLLEQADFSSLSPSVRETFDKLETSDFEYVIKSLRDAAKVTSAYKDNLDLSQKLLEDAESVKELLVRTIADNHPNCPNEIEDKEYLTCQKFLDHFHTIYTLNYDLLLYWTKMHNSSSRKTQSDDGFRTSYNDKISNSTSDYVVWDSGIKTQSMWFLHGALHIFDSATQVKKYTWKRTNIRLINQIREALDQDMFPLFVAEGSSSEKLDRIRHSDYLAKAYRSFQSIGKCLFIYGHSLSENDEHYLSLIERGKIEHLFVGIRGDINSEKNLSKVERAKLMVSRRDKLNENKSISKRIVLRLDFFDMSTVSIWK